MQRQSSIPKTFMQRMSRATWRLLGNSLYQGLIAQLSIIEAKHLLCKFCALYHKEIEITQFWIMFAFLTFLLMVINNMIGSILLRSPLAKSSGYTAKFTRSGAVYGYM